MKSNKCRALLPVMTICMALTGCADTPKSVYTPYVPVDYRNDTVSEPAVTESALVDEPVIETVIELVDETVIETVNAPADEPVIAPENETDDTSAAPDDTLSPSTPENPADNTELTPVNEAAEYQYHRPTPEERRLANMQMYLDYCSVQADVETDRSACVIDVRTAGNPYDVVWDYGYHYDDIVSYCDWSMVFDADYYMAQFPVLAYQYHYDEDLLLRHFQTVGVHEGRQGSASFNVAEYMTKCPEDVKSLFGDCYAAYYFYWMRAETDRDMDVSGNGQPRQMTAVMTTMQRYELKQVNALREKLGVEPLVFDSELAAFGNFRAWVDATEDWEMHEWLHENVAEVNKIVKMFSGVDVGENTVKHYWKRPVNWYELYYNSKPHRAAMTNPDNVYIGCSNAYLGDCEHKGKEMVMVELDMFAGDLSTTLNH